MGLTIHYQLTTPLTEIADIRTLVETMRQCARDLPFKEISDVVEFQGKDAAFENSSKGDEFRWFKVQAGQYVQDGERHFEVTPSHIIGFSTWPGDGCEEANFGFCRYPASVACPTRFGLKQRRATHLDGWRWSSFCKTQYASHPDCGGVENFLHCHLAVVKLLDFAKSTSLVTVKVNDEGGYWEDRNLEKLASEVGNWNEFIAAFAGSLKDAAATHGVQVESAIAGFQDFEHLEAKGLARLKGLKGKRPQDRS